MSTVYRVGSHHATAYFNTAKDAARYKPGGEEPESVDRLDAADECNDLLTRVEQSERLWNSARLLLEGLLDVCPSGVIHGTEAGRRASKFIADNPLPAADSSDRDGGRSYGV